MRQLIVPLLLLLPIQAASAQALSGPVVVIDGDTLNMTGERIRLVGIDAPERQQTCQRGDQAWACGKDAKALLANMIAGKAVECEPLDRDAYGRTVARCYADGRELGSIMVREGLAIALPNGSADYAAAEATAKNFRLGLWASTFQTPAEYRAANPQQFVRPASPRPTLATHARPVAQGSVWFRNCADARAAGAAPLHRGHPGYRPEMDGDGDGIACEPFRGRR